VYSDFYEIPLPALRFEKVEETDTKSEMTPKRTTPSKSNTSKARNNTQERKADSLARDDMQRKLERFQNKRPNDANQIRTEASFIREIKLTNSKNGCH